MPLMPDAREEARKVVHHMMEIDREYTPDRALERVLADAPFVDRDSLVEGLEAFHAERMERTPSLTKYPEAGPWIDYIRTFQNEVAEQAGFTPLQAALKFSLNDFLRWRGFIQAKLVTAERCRVAYVPDTDQGQLHIKNVDDPITHFKRRAPITRWSDRCERGFVTDGVGSGLHLDDEPEEIFPLPVKDPMLAMYAGDVSSAVAFLERYSLFWGGGNLLVHDWKGNSVAIEKCSYNFFEAFEPGPDGRSHISGMTCRDPDSPQGAYQRRKRAEYVERFEMGEDCSDNAFWAACHKFERKLADGLANLGDKPRAQDVIDLFRKPWPEGLNKNGLRVHPKQGLIGYTLIVECQLHDQRRNLRWQRDPEDASFPEEPEVYQF